MMTRTSNNRPPPPATPPITFFALDDKPSTTSNNYNEYDQLNPQARVHNSEIVANSNKLKLCSFKKPNHHKLLQANGLEMTAKIYKEEE